MSVETMHERISVLRDQNERMRPVVESAKKCVEGRDMPALVAAVYTVDDELGYRLAKLDEEVRAYKEAKSDE